MLNMFQEVKFVNVNKNLNYIVIYKYKNVNIIIIKKNLFLIMFIIPYILIFQWFIINTYNYIYKIFNILNRNY